MLPGWFEKPGAYVLVDGQFGSTGKGLLASCVARWGHKHITCVTTNAGPNSGHTAFHEGEKIVTTQIPVGAVILQRMGFDPYIYLNGGAIINPKQLIKEIMSLHVEMRKMLVHPCAAVIQDGDLELAQDALNRIASTGKGTGPALANKCNRLPTTAGMLLQSNGWISPCLGNHEWNWNVDKVFVETAQGFSLGFHSHQFYPHVTSRECTVMQALADARIPAQMLRKVAACYRTFPIRVGNTSGSSGDCYPDQREMEWSELGVEPELTTVTKRPRRLFTWSRLQFMESVAANRPDVLFLNFIEYLKREDQAPFVDVCMADYHRVMGRMPEVMLLGFGPKADDVVIAWTARV